MRRERLLLCEGADSSIIPGLALPQMEGEQGLYMGVQVHLEYCSKLGLSVLVMAMKSIREVGFMR